MPTIDDGAVKQGPREIHDHPPTGAVLLGSSRKRVYLTPWGERRVVEKSQHGSMPYLSDDVVGYFCGVGPGRGVVSYRWIRDRSLKPSRESKCKKLHHLALVSGD